MAEHVNVDTFVRAESGRMFQAIAAQAGGVNRWMHNRVPTPIDDQPVIRQNRDTLYSAMLLDLEGGATLTLPDPGERYLSAMILNEDHHVMRVIHEPGEHRLDARELASRYVVVGVRVLVDPDDDADVSAVNALQDELAVEAASAEPFVLPDYDPASFDATRSALLTLARGLGGFDRAFGRPEEVDPVRHLIGTAAGYGGLPSSEASYLNVDPGLPVGAYALTVGEVPVDGFWSITVYNADGYLEEAGGLTNVNSVTAERDGDGTVTVHFGGPDDGSPNRLGLMDGWNYLVRMYRPRAEVLDGTWTFPSLTAVD